jgi:hypothetical protein
LRHFLYRTRPFLLQCECYCPSNASSRNPSVLKRKLLEDSIEEQLDRCSYNFDLSTPRQIILLASNIALSMRMMMMMIAVVKVIPAVPCSLFACWCRLAAAFPNKHFCKFAVRAKTWLVRDRDCRRPDADGQVRYINGIYL